MTTPAQPTVPLPDQVTDVIYFCTTCKGKATFGAAYFSEVGEPTTCPNCGTAYSEQDQHDRIHRMPDDTPADLDRKRDDLFKKRDDRLPSRPKPTDPREIRKQKIKELRDQLRELEAEDEATDEERDRVTGLAIPPIVPGGRPPGIRLSP